MKKDNIDLFHCPLLLSHTPFLTNNIPSHVSMVLHCKNGISTFSE